MENSKPMPWGIDDRLRARAKQVIHQGLALGLPPAKQWWNWPAKLAGAQSIADQESAIHQGHRNDAGDAMRHAEWSKRMSEEIDPLTSKLVGIGHEAEGSLAHRPTWLFGGRAQPISEAVMDLHNNAQGIRAFREGLPIDPGRLQTHPLPPLAAIRGALRRAPATSHGEARR